MKQHLSHLLILSLAALLASGCGKPSAVELENRKLLEATLTAVTIRNPEELQRDAALIDSRHESGNLSDENYQAIKEMIQTAQSGSWAAAEESLYEFRKANRFFK